MKSNVTLTYSSGWKLTFRADGMAPRLFMEWIAEYQVDKNVVLPPFHIECGNKNDNSIFIVRFNSIIRKEVEELATYIRDNSPH